MGTCDHLSKYQFITYIINEFERRAESEDDKTDEWRERERKARLKGSPKKAHYFQRKRLYHEGYTDGLYLAVYVLKTWRDEVDRNER